MSLVKGNIDLDFFDQNPALKAKSEIKELLRQYPEEASKVMWTIYLIEDPASPLYRIPRNLRIEEVQQTYYNIDLEKHKTLIDAYARLSMSKEEVMFKVHMDTMDRLTAFLKDLSLDDEKEFNKVVRIMEKLPKMWEGLEKVKQKMIEAEQGTTLKGGAKESAREKRKK